MALVRILPAWALHRRMLFLVVSLVGFMTSEAASAGGQGFVIGAVCTGGGQLCNNMATFHLMTPVAGGTPMVKFTPGPFICSNFRIHYLVDDTEVAVTGFVGPKQNTGLTSLGFLGSGTYTVGMVAEGEVSGCNVGNLLSWGGKAKIKGSKKVP